MAEVSQRTWRIPGQRGRRKAWGFTLQVPCQPCPHKGKTGDGPVHPDGVRQEKHYRAEWTREDAEEALAKLKLGIEEPKPISGLTFGEAVDRYLRAKSRKKSIKDDERHLAAFKAYFGTETPLMEITAARISTWKAEKLAATCPQTTRGYSAAAINRPLAALRHLLQLAKEEWEVLPAVPKIRLEKEPEGRVRFLTDDEQTRLLAACRESINPELPTIVLVFLHTGGRKSEVLGLSWERGVDFAQGVVKFHETKNGKSRSVPMTEAVYGALSALSGPREGRVFRTRNIRTAFERAVARAGLTDFHIHDCRHTFASQLVMRGGTLQAIKELLGHHSLQMVLRYAHLSPAHLRETVARLEAKTATAVTLPTFTQTAPELAQELAQEVVR